METLSPNVYEVFTGEQSDAGRKRNPAQYPALSLPQIPPPPLSLCVCIGMVLFFPPHISCGAKLETRDLGERPSSHISLVLHLKSYHFGLKIFSKSNTLGTTPKSTDNHA